MEDAILRKTGIHTYIYVNVKTRNIMNYKFSPAGKRLWPSEMYTCLMDTLRAVLLLLLLKQDCPGCLITSQLSIFPKLVSSGSSEGIVTKGYPGQSSYISQRQQVWEKLKWRIMII